MKSGSENNGSQPMQVIRLCSYFIALFAALTPGVLPLGVVSSAQTTESALRPDLKRALSARKQVFDTTGRKGGYVPAQTERGFATRSHARSRNSGSDPGASTSAASVGSTRSDIPATTSIIAGTPLTRILHASQLSLISSAGTDEQFVDRDNDLIADERTTLDSAGGSFDLAVGRSGARYEVYSATLNNTLVGVLVVALDTNGDYQADTSSTYNLQRDFGLPSAAAVVAGTSTSGREFVIVSSSGYYNSSNPNDPNNEPSPGLVLLVRDPNTGGFDNSRSLELVHLGDNRLYNANALALLPNNDLLIADFHSDELRIMRDTNGDGMPDTLDATPYYSYPYADDAPLEIAANSRGVVFSHSAGNDVVMLAIYDDNADGRGDRDAVVVAGLSIDNNLFLHGLAVDRSGDVYVIEDASGSADGFGGNGGTPRIDAFRDGNLNGFLSDGLIFAEADNSVGLGLSGLSIALPPANQIDDSQFFVRQHYLDFLNREPDPDGWAYWTSQISECGADDLCVKARRIGVSGAFFVEQEFQQTGSFVYRLYKGGLGHQPDYAAFSADRTQVIGGSNLESDKQAFTLSFVQRNGFGQKYAGQTTADLFIDALVATILQSANVDLSSQRAALIGKYNTGDDMNHSRALALREAIDDAAFVNSEYNASFVLMQYFGYLRRDADRDGYDFWLNVLNNREPNNYRGMICSFLTSIEYQERFGLLLRRSNADCAQ
jgi:hypothetical protein